MAVLRFAIWAVLLGGPGLLGAWLYAKHELDDRVVEFVRDVRKIGISRGGRLPLLSTIRERVRRAAEKHHLRLDNLQVALVPIGDHNMDRLNPADRTIQQRATDKAMRLLEKRTGRLENHPVEEVRTGSGDSPQIETTQMEITVETYSKKWLWKKQRPITVKRVFRGGLRTSN